MKKWQRFFNTFIDKHSILPSDIIHELPRITIIGQIHVYIENHQGLVVYTDSELRLKLNQGFIQIIGHSFVLKTMLPKEILLEGNIEEVKFIT